MMTLRAASTALLAGLFAGLASPARADQIFVSVKGQLQGDLAGWWNPVDNLDGVDLSQAGMVDDLAWSVTSPRDAASGLPTGRRLHHPLTLRMRMSTATLQLAMAIRNNENLSELRVRWFVPSAETGANVFTRELLLLNANVASYSTYTLNQQGTLVTYVDVAFTYQKIGIHDVSGGVSYEDDWESPIR
ncbi:MAG: type VI secretion system tube protein Hcp [Myxococcota bacterium]